MLLVITFVLEFVPIPGSYISFLFLTKSSLVSYVHFPSGELGCLAVYIQAACPLQLLLLLL